VQERGGSRLVRLPRKALAQTQYSRSDMHQGVYLITVPCEEPVCSTVAAMVSQGIAAESLD
jgi:hypothetical protein